MSKNILEKIFSISVKHNLIKLISKTRNVVMTESINYKKKISANSIRNISLFFKIQVHGLIEEFTLIEIFEKIFHYKSGKKISIKFKSDIKFLEAYSFDFYQDYYCKRLYPFHTQKIIQFFNSLFDVGVLKFEDETLS